MHTHRITDRGITKRGVTEYGQCFYDQMVKKIQKRAERLMLFSSIMPRSSI